MITIKNTAHYNTKFGMIVDEKNMVIGNEYILDSKDYALINRNDIKPFTIYYVCKLESLKKYTNETFGDFIITAELYTIGED